MIVLPTPSDGNCLFFSLASFFKSPRIDHELMRRMVVHYIYQHADQFETDVVAEGYDSVDAYCAAMAQPNYWGDGIVCQCFALMFNVNVWISHNGEQVSQISHYDDRPHLALLLKGEHYERIISW